MSGPLHGLPAMLLLGVCLAVVGCGGKQTNPAPPTNGNATPGEGGFSAYYSLDKVEVTPQIPGYSLPLDWEKVANGKDFEHLTPDQRELLENHGFVLLGFERWDNIVDAYKEIEDRGDPVWVTPDAVLHVFHIQFGETLKTVEEQQLIPLARQLTERLQRDSEAQYKSFEGELQQAAQRNLAFFSVARQLLDPAAAPPEVVADLVREEISLIEAHTGFSDSPLFTYKEDYSQYVPRGHYTRSEPLKAYFKAMMWYGRMAFLLKGKDVSPTAMVSGEEARLQTLQAALVASLLYGLGPDAPAGPAGDWSRLYLVTAFFAGLADDLTPRQYADGIKEVAGAAFAWTKLAEVETLTALRDRLAALPKPRIYGGTGQVVLMPPFSPEQLNEVLADSQGLRFMGQRYTPDSFIFQRLLFPAVGPFTGQGQPFTMVETAGGPQRMFARGLDVMAVLGSDRALGHLQDGGDTAYGKYEESLAALRAQFGDLPVADWGRDLYMGWVYALQALIQPRPEGYPHFMRTGAWEDRQLQAALASWAQLRHDTILYAKQPMPPIAGMAPPGPEPEIKSIGYVEPQPEFYARMVALTGAMGIGLQGLGVMPEGTLARLQSLIKLLGDLQDISTTELAGEALTEEQEQTIKYFSAYLGQGLGDLDPLGLKTTVIADVQTEGTTSQVLEEGSGYLREIVVAYNDAAGHVFLGRGATLSYYEFKQPMQDRLTDEAWRQLLAGSKTPAPPAWVEALIAN